MNPAIIELLVLAGIAVFLIMRLSSVLGTREGHEKPPLAEPKPQPKRDFQVIDGGDDMDILDHAPKGSDTAEALAKMKRVDNDFSVNEFLGGARMAYEMILMAFERGDLTEVRGFISTDVLDIFDEVIANREAQGLSVEANFIGLREMRLVSANFDDVTRTADITVAYNAEMTSVVRNADGDIVEGDAKQIKRQKDTWTYSRTMGMGDPNWQLVATGE